MRDAVKQIEAALDPETGYSNGSPWNFGSLGLDENTMRGGAPRVRASKTPFKQPSLTIRRRTRSFQVAAWPTFGLQTTVVFERIGSSLDRRCTTLHTAARAL